MKRKTYIVRGSILFVILLFVLFIIMRQEQPPKLLDIDNPNEVFTIKESANGKDCLVAGKKNSHGVDNVLAASHTVNLRNYIGKKVRIKGNFIFSSYDAIENCMFLNNQNGYSNDRIILDISELSSL